MHGDLAKNLYSHKDVESMSFSELCDELKIILSKMLEKRESFK